MKSIVIWLSVISMTSDQGRYEPIVTPFESEEECIEETSKAVKAFGEQIQIADGEWVTYWGMSDSSGSISVLRILS